MVIRNSLPTSLVLATFALAVVPAGGAAAADECLAKPKGAAPAGKHWYYRTNREINRKCWFLADAGAKTVAARPPKERTPEPAVEPDQNISESADARAELVDETPAEQPVIPAEKPQAETSQGEAESMPPREDIIASRWPTTSEKFMLSRATMIDEVRTDAPAPVPGAAAASAVETVGNAGRASSVPFAAAIVLVVIGGAIIMAFASRRFSAQTSSADRSA